MQYDYDVIVVGGGAGGATFAYACARAGKSVLLLERGSRYTTTSASHDEKAMLIDKRPYDDREFDVNGQTKRLYMGGILGGGTSLYGGALVRPSDQDFQPGKYYGKRIPRRSGTGRFPMRTSSRITPRPSNSTVLLAAARKTLPRCKNPPAAIRATLCPCTRSTSA